MFKYLGAIITVIASFFVGYFSYKLFGPDNQVEQSCEQIIKDNVGIDVDFSPEVQK